MSDSTDRWDDEPCFFRQKLTLAVKKRKKGSILERGTKLDDIGKGLV
jgi:hypothetical protein